MVEIEKKKRQECKYERNVEARSFNHCGSGKVINITYSECSLIITLPTMH